MFVDKVRIYVRAGTGGNGCVSFRREKYIPKGGPNGGNGGKGGDVYLKANTQLTTLLDLSYRPHYEAQSGLGGLGGDKHGRNAEDLYINVPVGTVVFKLEKDKKKIPVDDLTVPGQELLVAQGGRGGRGNASFKTGQNKVPRFAERGGPAESAEYILELKLIADVGVMGCPNAGKSTLLSRITAARPKIADYPFTTLSPNLGVVSHKEKNFVVADIPGLIEGAHTGKGLGNEFLRHVERTRLLVHIIDVSGYEGRPAYKNFVLINNELKKYSKKLAKNKMIVVLNKMDLTGSAKLAAAFRRSSKKKTFGMSAVTGEGIPGVLDEIIRQLNKPLRKKKEQPKDVVKRYVFEAEFTIKKEKDVFLVEGRKIETFVAMTNFDQPQGVRRLQNIFKKLGLDKMLRKQGVQEGNVIRIGAKEFTYTDHPEKE